MSSFSFNDRFFIVLPSFQRYIRFRYTQNFLGVKKTELKRITQKTAPLTFDQRIAQLKTVHRGWINYFRMASMQSKIKDLDGWVRNRLSYCIWQDWKKPERKRKNLIRLGIRNSQALRGAEREWVYGRWRRVRS